MKKQVLLLILVFVFILTTSGTVTAVNTTEIVSISSNGNSSDSDSGQSSISADGRYVAFSSYADNLVDNDTNNYEDVFIRDRMLNITKIVSISSTGEYGDSDSYHPSISSNGRYIAFVSNANNLVENDNNECPDIFVRDLLLNTTERVSVSSNNLEGNGTSYAPSISSNGQYIAFLSYADNLVIRDNNNCSDIFVYNRISRTIQRVSISNNGVEGDYASWEPSISADGRYVVFSSYADNLVDNDGNGFEDVFVRDLVLNTTKRVSVSNMGKEILETSRNPSISADGNYVVFMVGEEPRPRLAMFDSDTLNSTINTLNIDEGEYYNYPFIFVYNMDTKTISKVSVSSIGEDADGKCDDPSINADGSYITFSSYADNLVPNDDNYCFDIFIYKNNFNSFFGLISPNNVKSGDSVIIKAYSENATSVTALIFNNTLNLTKHSDDGWEINYTIPQVSSGNYSVLLTAIDDEGNLKNLPINFTVDNTSPTISGTITPNLVKSGDRIVIKASSDPDTKSMVASIAGSENLNMYKDEDGNWWLYYIYYTIPNLSSGNYTVLLTAIDNVGNQGNTLLNFTVDNTPPTILATVSPDHIQLITDILPIDSNILIIKASSDPDTVSITIDGRYNMIHQQDGTWIFNCSFFDLFYSLSPGNYSIPLTATDYLGNHATTLVDLNIININPIIKVSATPYAIKSGDFVSITVSSSIDPKEIWGYFVGYSNINTGWINYNEAIPPLTKQEDGTWKTYYKLPNLQDGLCNIQLFLYYGDGIKGFNYFNYITSICPNVYAKFRVDNTPPQINPFVISSPIRSGDTLKIRAYSYVSHLEYWLWDDDTASITATLTNETLNMTKLWFDGHESLWGVDCTVPNLPDGSYTVFFNATDQAGNQMTTSTNFTVDNTPPQ